MKLILSVLAVSLLAAASAGAANIHKGNSEVNGTLDLARSSGNTSFSVTASGQYFWADQFSAGLEGSYYTYSHSRASYAIGPVATVYFLTSETIAPYFSLAPFDYVSFGSTHYIDTITKLGVKFFFNDAVAFGPAVQWTHTEKLNSSYDSNSVSLMGMFSIHL